MKEKTSGYFSGSVLKWIAVVTMLLDHVAASGLIDCWNLRLVGRTAFPLFAFLLAEGAVHTRNRKRYLLRLGIFALVSEIPFDLALWGKPFDWSHQNVYWTLFLGLLVIFLLQKFPPGSTEVWKAQLGFLLLALAGEGLHTDYGFAGITAVVLMYLLRERPWLRFLLCYGLLVLAFQTEAWCLPAFVLIALYNGTRGRQPKYFFYWFYPVHLFLIWLISIGGIG